jgi:hypothetical protein
MSPQMDNQSDQILTEITYTAADITALNLVIWRFWLVLVAIIPAALIVITMILESFDGYSLDEAIDAIDWPFTGLVTFLLVVWIIVASVVSYWWRGRKGLHGPIQFALTQDGVSFRSRQMEGVTFWNAIRSVKRDGGRAYLFISRRVAFIIPRRAFGSQTEFDAWADHAEALWRSAKSVTVE